jgi:hypothetical protein
MALHGIPLSEWSGSGATRELQETIKQQIASTDKQSKLIWRLTVFMAVLAFVQTIAAVVQIVPIIQSSKDKTTNEKLQSSINTSNEKETQPQSVVQNKSLQQPSIKK